MTKATASGDVLYHGVPAPLAPVYAEGGISLSDEIALASTEAVAWALGAWATGLMAHRGMRSLAGWQVDLIRRFAAAGGIAGDLDRWRPTLMDSITRLRSPLERAVAQAVKKAPTVAVAVVNVAGLAGLEDRDEIAAPQLPWEDGSRVAPGKVSRKPIPASRIVEWRLFPVPQLADPAVLRSMSAAVPECITVEDTPDDALPGVLSVRRLAAAYLDVWNPALAMHGPAHAAAVAQHGLRVAGPDTDLAVVLAFALLHDAARENDGPDPGHAARGAELAERLQAAGILDLEPDRLAVLRHALAHHTDFTASDDPTIGACWDADRLDLHRVRLTHARPLMSTPAGERLVDEPPPAPEAWPYIVARYVVAAGLA